MCFDSHSIGYIFYVALGRPKLTWSIYKRSNCTVFSSYLADNTVCFFNEDQLVNAVGDTLALHDYWKNGTQHIGALNGKNSKFVGLNLVVHILTT